MSDNQFRLVTRNDFDGLVSAVLLKELQLVGEILFVQPSEILDGSIDIGKYDILVNLPYVKGCHLAFDHHLYHQPPSSGTPHAADNLIIDASAPSSSRVLYDYYGGKKQFPSLSDDMLAAADRSDSAQFTRDEILSPTGWTLLNFLLDPRTGLDQFRQFKISTEALFQKLVDKCRHKNIEDILRLKDVQERVDFFFSHSETAKEQLRKCTTSHMNKTVLVVDLRNETVIYPMNRYMVYAIFPEANLSIHLTKHSESGDTLFVLGKSIFNRGNQLNIGEICRTYGGNGYLSTGQFQTPTHQADKTQKELIERIAMAA